MKGIVCEAIYPRVSQDNGGIPVRNFYFDSAQSGLERDIGVFLELARSYKRSRGVPRTAPCLALDARLRRAAAAQSSG